MKWMREAAKVLTVAGLIMLAAAIFSCNGNNGAKKGGVSSATGASGVAFVVSGEEFTTEDLLTSPLMRSPLREYCYSMTMLQKAREAKIEVSDEDIEAKIAETKVIVDQRNTTWQHFLDSQFLTEEEYWLNTKYSLMFERMVASRVTVSEEDMMRIWDEMQSSIIDQYLSDNHLPESERSSVEFDMVKDICEERAGASLQQTALMEVRNEIVQEATLELTSVSDPEKRKRFEDLVLNMARDSQDASSESRAQPGTPR
jgi:hypothetical protein